MIRFIEVHAAFVQSLSLQGRVCVMMSSQSRYMQGLALPPAFGRARRESVP
ncbi:MULTISPECIES: hypothetical protein [unclassified Stenotrophomonas]|uniref:hypothetical protein n=1 Tax=unclassified Stenotrophomonas TaxID=196198 RepID=UPI002117988D|nr:MULTISPECIES: hypothetical protein [unclassified Stenotrophomonas]